ncbi:PspA/IM30 family protein [Terrilactibacillus sp. BCM23-1]|uniref:PspA/IM30 family protein n=1 Tax=Terrilactibacillus tamarindi TaxID=2599694 RepID=A0A6N8CVH4_9BACI|nr:PspA/IM30 family protein [Terrilactibacillus tamarindi]MTT33255.1 PspA/IM30 family protein [Terrilactibacillus tamarindi]
MPNIFSRIKDTISSDINELLDKKEQKNPIAMLNTYLRQCEKETEKVRKLISRQYLLKEQFIREYHQTLELAEKRKKQANIASKAEEKDLYEFALKEQNYYEEAAVRLKQSYDTTTTQLDHLEQKYAEMKRKLKDMHLKRMELMGRENTARANHRMNQVLQTEKIGDSAFSRFEDTELYLDRLEYQVNTAYHRETIDTRIAELEKKLEK